MHDEPAEVLKVTEIQWFFNRQCKIAAALGGAVVAEHRTWCQVLAAENGGGHRAVVMGEGKRQQEFQSNGLTEADCSRETRRWICRSVGVIVSVVCVVEVRQMRRTAHSS